VNQQKSYPLVLIVDDDPVLRKALHEIFEFSGYAVMVAANAREGLEILRNAYEPPEVIISDMVMPEMDGFQFLQAVYLEEKWREIPFIFLSGKPKRSLEGANPRRVRYLPKPFPIEDLLTEVQGLLGQS
jgi:CheY-like chemotaxis protein